MQFLRAGIWKDLCLLNQHERFCEIGLSGTELVSKHPLVLVDHESRNTQVMLVCDDAKKFTAQSTP